MSREHELLREAVALILKDHPNGKRIRDMLEDGSLEQRL